MITPTPPRSDILTFLREETKVDHLRVEDNLAMHNLMAGTLSHDSYLFLLKNMYNFQSLIEIQILSHPFWKQHCIFDIKGRLKSGWLLKDIDFLKQSAGKHPRTASTIAHIPDIGSDANLLGALYVIEGSTLGGIVILQNLTQHYGYTSDTGAAYFAGHKNKTRELWMEFGSFLTETVRAMDLNYNEVLAAARQTFHCIDDVMRCA